MGSLYSVDLLYVYNASMVKGSWWSGFLYLEQDVCGSSIFKKLLRLFRLMVFSLWAIKLWDSVACPSIPENRVIQCCRSCFTVLNSKYCQYLLDKVEWTLDDVTDNSDFGGVSSDFAAYVGWHTVCFKVDEPVLSTVIDVVCQFIRNVPSVMQNDLKVGRVNNTQGDPGDSSVKIEDLEGFMEMFRDAIRMVVVMIPQHDFYLMSIRDEKWRQNHFERYLNLHGSKTC